MRIPDIIKEASKKLRNNMTKAEVILWKELKDDKIGVRFLRQKPVYVYTEDSGLDRFVIPDFYSFKEKLVIEVDGSVHNLKDVLELDIEKEKLLNNFGIKIIRFKNEDILNNIEDVIKQIKISLFQREYSEEGGGRD